MTNTTNDFKQEIISEIAYYEGWKDDFIAESFKLAEAYYNYKDEYLKE